MPGVLAVGAHPDDVELGCGGTLARHVEAGEDVTILVFTNGREEDASELWQQARESAQLLGADLKMLGYPDQRLDTYPLSDLVREVELLVNEIQPATVYTHSAGDLNLDHQLVARAVATACRPLPGSPVETLLAFEVLSSSEWGSDEPFTPTLYRNIDGELESKLAALGCYKDEMRDYPHPRSLVAVSTLASMRGQQVGMECAEAFEVLRVIA